MYPNASKTVSLIFFPDNSKIEKKKDLHSSINELLENVGQLAFTDAVKNEMDGERFVELLILISSVNCMSGSQEMPLTIEEMIK